MMARAARPRRQHADVPARRHGQRDHGQRSGAWPAGDPALRATDTFTIAGCAFTVRRRRRIPACRAVGADGTLTSTVLGDFVLTEEQRRLVHRGDQAPQGTVLIRRPRRRWSADDDRPWHGTTIAFPFRIDAGFGQAAQAAYAAHVDQMIRQVLLTAPGERVDLPEFGCGLRRLLFAPHVRRAACATTQRCSCAGAEPLARRADPGAGRRGAGARTTTTTPRC